MQKSLLLSLVLGSLGIGGCGGGGSSTTVVSSRYRGAYAGTFQEVPGGVVQTGNVTLTVDSHGKLTGMLNNVTTNMTSSLGGTISDSGKMSLVITNPTETDDAAGTVSLAANGHLVANLTLSPAPLDGNVGPFITGGNLGPLTWDATLQ